MSNSCSAAVGEVSALNIKKEIREEYWNWCKENRLKGSKAVGSA
jgi:hypothetical protein